MAVFNRKDAISRRSRTASRDIGRDEDPRHEASKSRSFGVIRLRASAVIT
jgi:hypothetical protein